MISSSGKQLGIISIREALNHAEDEGFDLVEVSPDAKPPVCKILDYGKLKYREQKSKKEAKKKQKTIEIKEIKIRPGINKHDYEVKVRALSKFIIPKETSQKFVNKINEGNKKGLSAQKLAKFVGKYVKTLSAGVR